MSTIITSTLQDLARHMTWADAEQWRALEQHPVALQDEAIRNRLHHIHLVQYAFVGFVGQDGSPFERTTPADFPTSDTLKAYGRRWSTTLAHLIETAGPDVLARSVPIPFFKDPPLVLSGQEALTQAVMHSQWHRGQNSTRLRELGAEPPMLDMIIWIWKGRPEAAW
jgi:uncharacterized damage-inducible protein DinB